MNQEENEVLNWICAPPQDVYRYIHHSEIAALEKLLD